MSLIKKGIIASENLAIGKIKLMKKQEVKISSEKISDDEIKLHVEKFNKALNDYKTFEYVRRSFSIRKCDFKN